MRIVSRALGPRDTDHEFVWTSVGVACATLAALALALGAPVPVPACPFKALTGWPCLTCGGTRAIRALFSLDTTAAWRLNPLVTVVATGWATYALYGVGAIVNAWPRMRVELESKEGTAVRIAVVACALATWTFLVIDGR